MDGRSHAFRLLVHSDSSAPPIEYGKSHGTLEVGTKETLLVALNIFELK